MLLSAYTADSGKNSTTSCTTKLLPALDGPLAASETGLPSTRLVRHRYVTLAKRSSPTTPRECRAMEKSASRARDVAIGGGTAGTGSGGTVAALLGGDISGNGSEPLLPAACVS